MAYIKSIRKIYSDGRHNAFTDMEYWNGHYYVSFRNGPRHPTLPGMWGSGMIIRSSDLEFWDVCARFEMEGIDTSNPRLLDLGDELGALGRAIFSKKPGLLRLYEGESGIQSYMRFTSNGTVWSDPEPVLHNDNYFWRPVRFGNVWYITEWSAAEGLRLARSTDTRDWQIISTIPPTPKIRYTFEGEIWITDDEVMHIIIRAYENQDPAYLAESKPPYTDWKLAELNYTVHCPVCKPVGDEVWIAGRAYTAQFPPSVEIPPGPTREKIASLVWRDGRLAKTPAWHTAIWRFIDGKLDPILVFPSAGDCGYPGMVVEKDRILLSYYSQHDVDQAPKSKPGEIANDIYLAEVVV